MLLLSGALSTCKTVYIVHLREIVCINKYKYLFRINSEVHVSMLTCCVAALPSVTLMLYSCCE